MTVIKGVADRVPKTLAAAGAEDVPPAGALAMAVRSGGPGRIPHARPVRRTSRRDRRAALVPGRGHRETVEGSMTAHLRELRLLRVTEPEESDRFVVTEGQGDAFELLSPAYVDELTGKVILAGQLRRVAGPEGMKGGEEA